MSDKYFLFIRFYPFVISNNFTKTHLSPLSNNCNISLQWAALQPLTQLCQEQMCIAELCFTWYQIQILWHIKADASPVLALCCLLGAVILMFFERKKKFIFVNPFGSLFYYHKEQQNHPAFVNCQSWQRWLCESSVPPSTLFRGGEGDRGQLTYSVCAGKPHVKHVISLYFSPFLTFKPSSDVHTNKTVCQHGWRELKWDQQQWHCEWISNGEHSENWDRHLFPGKISLYIYSSTIKFMAQRYLFK